MKSMGDFKEKKIQSGFPTLSCFTRSGVRTICDLPPPVPSMAVYLDFHISGNCQTVAKIGVTVVYTPKGVTQDLFDEAISKFPSPGQIIGKRR